MRTRFTLAMASFSLLASIAAADIRLPALISDHMVLQQNATVTLWGWGDPGQHVLIRGSWGVSTSCTTDPKGRWSATIKTPDGGDTEHILTFIGGNTLTVRDVLIGEVWVCSGQSNMEWPLSAANDAKNEIASAEAPQIRLINVANVTSLVPLEDVKGSWSVCTPRAAGGFSAVGYTFARELHAALKMPIGLIQSDWGGTPAEAWTDEVSLSRLGDFEQALTQVREAAKSQAATDPAAAERAWFASLHTFDEGEKASPSWAAPEYDDSAWDAITVPGQWPAPLASFDGFVWLRTRFEVSAAAAAGGAQLELGPIDDCDTVYVNGTLVGGMMEDGKWNAPRKYEVPASVLHSGTNVLAVRVLDTGGLGGLSAKPQEVLLRMADGSASIPLAGSSWKSKASTAMTKLPARPAQIPGPWTPTALYNGMIAPLSNYEVKGAIWYQGESNVGRAEQYQRLFPAMIDGWRRMWKEPRLPFYFVQIAPFGYQNDRGAAALLKEAQAITSTKTPYTAMAATIDIGNPTDIHPTNKRDVGHRLALHALNKTYNLTQFACENPSYRSMKVEGNSIRLELANAKDLKSPGALKHFAIAGKDREFVAATATIDGETIVVHSDKVTEPVAVRFAWGATDESHLVNGDGLPLTTFRTDDWPE